MKYLLDTHIIMWALIDDPRINDEVKRIILNTNNSIYYSSASSWEVEIKHLKNTSFKLSAEQFCFLCDQNGLLNIPITNDHVNVLKDIEKAGGLEHNDPFDKMLLAQAKKEKMTFITHDSKFKNYEESNIILI